jgi:acetyltransferase-like isoleucine patch superfamily enzyme
MAMQNPAKKRTLGDEHFMRHRLYGGKMPAWRRYTGLVLAKPTLWNLLRYELINLFVMHLPGALGLAARKIIVRRLFASCGKDVVFGRSLTLRHPERIRIGAGVMLDDHCLLDGHGAGSEGLVLGDQVVVNRGTSLQAKVGSISVGESTSIGGGSKIISQGPIRIGRNVSIAADVAIAGGRYVVEQGEKTGEKLRFTGGEISIGDHVRIGMRSVIQDGVVIGEGAIVAPGSIVVSDVEPYTVVSGNPARPWRERRQNNSGSLDRPSTEAQEGVRERIRQYLKQAHHATFGSADLTEDSSLFEHGILDSVAMVGLATWMETTFDFVLDESD